MFRLPPPLWSDSLYRIPHSNHLVKRFLHIFSEFSQVQIASKKATVGEISLEYLEIGWFGFHLAAYTSV
jgi:hypothetical protein